MRNNHNLNTFFVCRFFCAFCCCFFQLSQSINLASKTFLKSQKKIEVIDLIWIFLIERSIGFSWWYLVNQEVFWTLKNQTLRSLVLQLYLLNSDVLTSQNCFLKVFYRHSLFCLSVFSFADTGDSPESLNFDCWSAVCDVF